MDSDVTVNDIDLERWQEENVPGYRERKQWRIQGLCEHCGKHPSTIRWVGVGSSLDLVHGLYEMWCETCVTRAQLEFAKKAAERVSELQVKLRELENR